MAYRTPSTKNNLLTVQYDLRYMARKILDVTGNKAAYNSFVVNIPKVINSPPLLSSLLFSQTEPLGFLETIALSNTTFLQFKKLATIGNDLSNAMNDIIVDILPIESRLAEQQYESEIDTSIALWESNTVERKERNTNRQTLVEAFRLVMLVGMFEVAARDSYTTTRDIEKRKQTLDNYYEDIVENCTSCLIMNSEKKNLDIVKTRTEQVLNSKSQSAYGITTAKLERKYSAKQVTYDLYGEYIKNEAQLNYLTNIIIGLNRSQPSHALEGIIDIVEIR